MRNAALSDHSQVVNTRSKGRDGRTGPADSAQHVSILASNLSIDPGTDRPLRGSGDAARVQAASAFGVRGHDGAARGRPALLREARPDALRRYPALLPDQRS